MKSKKLLLSLVIALYSQNAFACDSCLIDNSFEYKKPEAMHLNLGISEDFVGYGKVRLDNEKIPSKQGQYLKSYVTDIVGRYDYTDSSAVEVHVPFIDHSSKRLENGDLTRADESGLGDISILLKSVVYSSVRPEAVFNINLLAGVKLATGDSDRLSEESTEDPNEFVDGHLLALGSGSTDVPLGAGMFFRSGSIITRGDIEYVIRSEGDHNYRYANSLFWKAGVGVIPGSDDSVVLSLNLSGEHQGSDEINGAKTDDTDLDMLYLGPEVVGNINQDLTGYARVEFPVHEDAAGLQAIIDHRVIVGLFYSF